MYFLNKNAFLASVVFPFPCHVVLSSDERAALCNTIFAHGLPAPLFGV